jgi:AcrR family transcriptional regulator
METRQRIINAAFKLYSSEGYSAITTERLARAAGIGKPTLYRYFSSKEALLLTCVEEMIKIIDAETSLVLHNTLLSPKEKMIGVINPVLRYLNGLHPAALDDIRRSVPEAYEMIEQNRKRLIFRNFANIVAEGKQNGVLRADLDGTLLAHVLVGAVKQLSMPEVQRETGLPFDQLLTNMMTILWDGCLSKHP